MHHTNREKILKKGAIGTRHSTPYYVPVFKCRKMDLEIDEDKYLHFFYHTFSRLPCKEMGFSNTKLLDQPISPTSTRSRIPINSIYSRYQFDHLPIRTPIICQVSDRRFVIKPTSTKKITTSKPPFHVIRNIGAKIVAKWTRSINPYSYNKTSPPLYRYFVLSNAQIDTADLRPDIYPIYVQNRRYSKLNLPDCLNLSLICSLWRVIAYVRTQLATLYENSLAIRHRFRRIPINLARPSYAKP